MYEEYKDTPVVESGKATMSKIAETASSVGSSAFSKADEMSGGKLGPAAA